MVQSGNTRTQHHLPNADSIRSSNSSSLVVESIVRKVMSELSLQSLDTSDHLAAVVDASTRSTVSRHDDSAAKKKKKTKSKAKTKRCHNYVVGANGIVTEAPTALPFEEKTKSKKSKKTKAKKTAKSDHTRGSRSNRDKKLINEKISKIGELYSELRQLQCKRGSAVSEVKVEGEEDLLDQAVHFFVDRPLVPPRSSGETTESSRARQHAPKEILDSMISPFRSTRGHSEKSARRLRSIDATKFDTNSGTDTIIGDAKIDTDPSAVGSMEFYRSVASKIKPQVRSSICIQDDLGHSMSESEEDKNEDYTSIDPDFDSVFRPDDMRCLALVSHNEMKPTMKAFVECHKYILKKFRLTGTSSTMAMLREVLGDDDPSVVFGPTCSSGPLGGDAELVALMATGQLGGILFFQDPMSAHPHQCDIECLNRQAVVHNTIVATTPTTAVVIVSVLETALKTGKADMIPSFFFSLQCPSVDAYKDGTKEQDRKSFQQRCDDNNNNNNNNASESRSVLQESGPQQQLVHNGDNLRQFVDYRTGKYPRSEGGSLILSNSVESAMDLGIPQNFLYRRAWCTQF